MDKKIKDYIGLSGITAIMLLSFAAMWFSFSYSRSIEPSILESFTISAEGKVVAIPDVAQFSFSVITEGGENISSLTGDNTEKVNSIIAFIKESGVEEKDIKTSQYSISPRYQYYDCNNIRTPSGENICPPPEIVGYTVRQSVSVKVRDFEKIGVVIAGVSANGANTVSGLSFKIDDTDALQNEARTQAIVRAREKAEAIAKAGKFRIGKLISLDEGYAPSYRYGVGGVAESLAFSDAKQSPSIEPGSQEVTINVTLRYEIK